MTGDLILEERQWRSGIEMVSHVNHTQIARVRMSLGIAVEPWRHALAKRPRLIAGSAPSVRRRKVKWSRKAVPRAAAGS
jgi:hypothetical protein